ncbi:MAG: DUF4367 domain-containing protein [Firmicutes bacterium]|nr:DUF4367 domain-containing protein [Bacillota bacterium]
MNTQISKEDIRNAAIIVGNSIAAFDTSNIPSHTFSDRHETAMRRILSLIASDTGRTRRRPFVRRLVACIVAILILFAGAYAFIPSVHAAVNEWFTTVWNNIVTYYFPHSGNDHAFPVLTPTSIPERFEIESDTASDGARTIRYIDKANGDFIVFDYRWISQRQADKLKQSMENDDTVVLYSGYNALLQESNNKCVLKWYEPHNLLGFTVESNIAAEELIQAFSAMDIHLPEYAPTWIPEGFELVYEDRDPGSTTLTYMHTETGDIIGLDYYDYGNIDIFGGDLTEADVIENVSINGHKASLVYTDSTDPEYDTNNVFNGLVLIWVDNNSKMIFAIDSSLEKEEVIRFAESITKVR